MENINKFIKFAAKELQLSSLPKIHLVGKEEDKYAAFGHSKDDTIWVRVTGRHPGDIMRTIAHELTHFSQNHKGTKGDKMREDQANALAGRIMRKFNTENPEIFKDAPIPEEVGSMIHNNLMGASSSTQGTGAIATIDPLIKPKNKQNNFLTQRVHDMKKLSDIIGSNSTLKKLNTKFKRTQ
jgi:hypothetical protein